MSAEMYGASYNTAAAPSYAYPGSGVLNTSDIYGGYYSDPLMSGGYADPYGMGSYGPSYMDPSMMMPADDGKSAVMGGLSDAVGGIVQSFTKPSTWLMIAGTIGLGIICPPAALAVGGIFTALAGCQLFKGIAGLFGAKDKQSQRAAWANIFGGGLGTVLGFLGFKKGASHLAGKPVTLRQGVGVVGQQLKASAVNLRRNGLKSLRPGGNMHVPRHRRWLRFIPSVSPTSRMQGMIGLAKTVAGAVRLGRAFAGLHPVVKSTANTYSRAFSVAKGMGMNSRQAQWAALRTAGNRLMRQAKTKFGIDLAGTLAEAKTAFGMLRPEFRSSITDIVSKHRIHPVRVLHAGWNVAKLPMTWSKILKDFHNKNIAAPAGGSSSMPNLLRVSELFKGAKQKRKDVGQLGAGLGLLRSGLADMGLTFGRGGVMSPGGKGISGAVRGPGGQIGVVSSVPALTQGAGQPQFDPSMLALGGGVPMMA